MVFQNPLSSLNLRFTVAQTIGEALRFHRIVPDAEVPTEIERLLRLVGLTPEMAQRAPRQLSGGQCQRVGLARALSVRPSMLVLDEPVAALDVSIQAQVLNLLDDLRRELGLTMLFIAHELSVVRHMSHRVAVMYLGKIVEIGTSDEIFAAAQPSLYAKPARRRAAAGPGQASAPGRAQGRHPQPLCHSAGLSVPDTLPEGARHLPQGGATEHYTFTDAQGRLSFRHRHGYARLNSTFRASQQPMRSSSAFPSADRRTRTVQPPGGGGDVGHLAIRIDTLAPEICLRIICGVSPGKLMPIFLPLSCATLLICGRATSQNGVL